MEKSIVSGKPVAVIILNWNGLEMLKKYLPEVLGTTDSRLCDLIVADNGSEDGSVQWLRENFDMSELRIMEFKENYGFAMGYNKAIAEAGDYKYVVLLNSDLVTTPGCGKVLYEYMESHPDVAACQPKILSLANPSYFEYAGACGGFLDCNGYPYCRGRIFDCCEEDRGQYDIPMEVFWASGAALMVRRDVYLDCGGLDSQFFAHMEEIDLCWRMQIAGYKIAAVPAASVYHLGGGSLPAENPKKTYLNFRNNLLMLHKNLPAKGKNRFLLRRRLLDTLAWVKYVACMDWKNARAIFKAHRDYAKMRTNYQLEENPEILSLTPQGRLNMLIARYLNGKKKYSDLNFKK